MLVTSTFSFSHNVFRRLLSQCRYNSGLYGNGLPCNECKPFNRRLLETFWERRNMLVISIFCFLHGVPDSFTYLSYISANSNSVTVRQYCIICSVQTIIIVIFCYQVKGVTTLPHNPTFNSPENEGF